MVTKKITYFIVPCNEGQGLNYIESFRGNFVEALERAKTLATELQSILEEATITVEVQDLCGKAIQRRLPSLIV